MLVPLRLQLSLAHLPPWVCWEFRCREVRQRAALMPVPQLGIPEWRHRPPSPVHAIVAERSRREPPPCPTTAEERELIRRFVTTDEPEVMLLLEPAFLSWVRGDLEQHQQPQRPARRMRTDAEPSATLSDHELERIANAVRWPGD